MLNAFPKLFNALKDLFIICSLFLLTGLLLLPQPFLHSCPVQSCVFHATLVLVGYMCIPVGVLVEHGRAYDTNNNGSGSSKYFSANSSTLNVTFWKEMCSWHLRNRKQHLRPASYTVCYITIFIQDLVYSKDELLYQFNNGDSNIIRNIIYNLQLCIYYFVLYLPTDTKQMNATIGTIKTTDTCSWIWLCQL